MLKETKKRKCYNCAYAGKQFKIGKLSHLHCENKELYNQEKNDSGVTSGWDSLRVFSDTCDKYSKKDA